MTEKQAGESIPDFSSNVVIIVFGASGDLAKKKTFPALFELYRRGLFPEKLSIVGYARTKMDDNEFRDKISKNLKLDDDKAKGKIEEFRKLCSYVHGSYDEDSGFKKLEERIRKEESSTGSEKRNRLFYLALPPSVFATVCTHLKNINHSEDDGNSRVIIEKPFGHDLESSQKLQKQISSVWSESELYRIDHYLGKEMVKNFLTMRFTNHVFSAAWNKNYINNVQLEFKEPFGTEGRGGYFDEIGIIRDVMQNHLLQVLSLVAMERPVSSNAEDIRDEKVKVLKAIQPIDHNKVVLGQYDKSVDGSKPAYVDDDTVNKESKAVTYAALDVEIHNERWEGVPFILKAGKALDEGKVEVRIQFKDVAKGFVNRDQTVERNELVVRIQPNEAIYLKVNCKYPGLGSKTVVTNLDLTYNERYTDLHIPEAYESLILDALKGDHSNFVRDDELDVSWQIFTPLLHWIEEQGKNLNLEYYPYGSKGPDSLDKYLAERGFIDYENPAGNLTRMESKGKL